MKKIVAILGFLLAGALHASGTVNTLPKYTSASQLGNSNVTDNGSTVTISVPLVVSTPTVTQLKFADGSSQTSAATGNITGSGTAGTVAKFNGSTTAIGNSLLTDDATNVTLSSGKLILPNGSAGAPSLAFGTQTIGLWRPNATALAINGNNVQINDQTNNGAFTFDTQNDTLQGAFNGTTAGAPGIKSAIGAGTTTGIYWPVAGTIGMTASGTSILQGTNAGARLLATTGADSAAAGDYGEFSATTTIIFANIATSGQFGNVVSFSLTAGDWDLSANVTLKLNGAVITDYEVAVSSFSANTTTDHVEGYNWIESSAFPIATANASASVPRYRVTLAGTTTFFLKAKGAFSAATPQALGTMTARRAR